jgi:hypothetical protein
MRSRIVRLIVPAIAVLSVAMVAHAQSELGRYSTSDCDRIMRVFDVSLHSQCPGVIESTIYNLVEFKNAYPDREYSRQVSALKKIARECDDATIAYKANLAGMYLTYGTRFADSSVFNPSNHETAFRFVDEQLARKFLLSRSGN